MEDEDMVSLLSQFELLHKCYKEAMLDIRKLRAKLSMETQKREAAEMFSHSIDQERQRLFKAQGETFSKMLQQLELRSQFDDMMNELKFLKLQLESKEEEKKELLKAIGNKNSAEICALQNQIRQSQDELTLRDAAVAHLEQELSCLRSTMRDFQQSSERALEDATSKCRVLVPSLDVYVHYNLPQSVEFWCFSFACMIKFTGPDQLETSEMKRKLELLAQDRNMLEDCLLQEKTMLQDRLQSLEKQLMAERADFEKRLRESSVSRHSEVFKQKIMRLRKENEDLRLQLHGGIHH